MRRIIASAFISLDGVIQGPGGPNEDPTGGFTEGGWVFKLWDDGLDAMMGPFFDRDYDLLLGRRTHDIFAAYWPFAAGEEAAMGEAFTKSNKYVLTRGSPDLGWANSHALGSIEEVAKLKRGDGPDLIIQGSSGIYAALIGAGLIDRLTLMTFPITLGAGKRLFGEDTPVGLLKLVEHTITPKGTIVATYEPGGDLPPFPAEAPQPSTSAREAERQRRMAEGSW